MTITHAGYVALVGRPNVGKSTLLNNLVGEKISITSSKPQTTRWQILGIKTLLDTQVIYIDTPGIHDDAKKSVNRYMNRIARAVLEDANVILFLIDANYWHKEDELVLRHLKNIETPVILVINKIDLLKDKTQLLPLINQLKEKYSFKQIMPISALKEKNITLLEQEISKILPTGAALFPEDQITDKSLRFHVAEIIREKIIQSTEQELPYATTVVIEEFKQEENLTTIGAVIWVERQGQKIILIGKSGSKLKKIGKAARVEMEEVLGGKVFLRLWIKVKEHWTDDDKALRGLGYE